MLVEAGTPLAVAHGPQSTAGPIGLVASRVSSSHRPRSPCVLGFGRDVEVEREQLREQVVVGQEPVGAEHGGIELSVQCAEPALAGLSQRVVLAGERHPGGEVVRADLQESAPANSPVSTPPSSAPARSSLTTPPTPHRDPTPPTPKTKPSTPPPADSSSP